MDMLEDDFGLTIVSADFETIDEAASHSSNDETLSIQELDESKEDRGSQFDLTVFNEEENVRDQKRIQDSNDYDSTSLSIVEEDAEEERRWEAIQSSTGLRPLGGTAVLLKAALGEKALADWVVSDVRDFMRLDSLDKIRKATTASEVCTQLRKYHDDDSNGNSTDSAIAEAALKKLDELRYRCGFNYLYPKPPQSVSLNQSLFEARHALVNCMLAYPTNAEIQHKGYIMLNSVLPETDGIANLAVLGEIGNFLVSERFFSAMLGMVEHNPNNALLVHCGLSSVSNMDQTLLGIERILSRMSAGYVSVNSPFAIYFRRLRDSNAVPLAFSALTRHETDCEIALHAMTIFKKSRFSPGQQPTPHPFIQSTANFFEIVRGIVEPIIWADPDFIEDELLNEWSIVRVQEQDGL